MRLIEYFNTLPSLCVCVCFLSGTRNETNVWNRTDITSSIDIGIHSYNPEVFSRILKRIEDRVKELFQRIEGVPLDLIEGMKAISHSVGNQVVSIRLFALWTPDCINSQFDFQISYWTAYGTVDVKRQEERLAHIKMIDTDLRYFLASNDCFEKIVEGIFDLKTDDQIAVFLPFDTHRKLKGYWTRRQSNDLSTYENLISQNRYVIEHNNTVHQFAFLYALLTANKEYFLNFLSRDIYELVAENHAQLIAELYE
ncbi:hypothetical protein TNCV_838641 [Trichonephila clavipes]|nr:hypothetical protein TNCV_838641 [Trichonephila clavipes]